MLKNKKIIIILAVAIIFLLVFLTSKNKDKIIETKTNIIPDVENMEEIINKEKDIEIELTNALRKIEEDYKKGKASYDGYTRSAFYNEERINMEFANGNMKFVNLNEINSGELYDDKGKKLESYKDIDLKGENLSDDGLIETGKSYAIRVPDYQGVVAVNYYYLAKITNDGVGELRWICFTENERITDDYIDQEYMDLELTENGGIF